MKRNDFNLPEIRDLTAVPSDELNERTLAAMKQAEFRKTKKKIPLARRITVCAALFCAALVLMGAGVRIFEYLTFVPGMGIVTADQEEVFTLTKTVSAAIRKLTGIIPVEVGPVAVLIPPSPLVRHGTVGNCYVIVSVLRGEWAALMVAERVPWEKNTCLKLSNLSFFSFQGASFF